MELYKSRNFSELFQDTFEFLKLNGKHLFKHYFVVTGVFILILAAFAYLLTKFVLPDIFGDVLEAFPMEFQQTNSYENIIPLIILGFATFGIISVLVVYSYVPVYLKLYAKNMNTDFSTHDLIDLYKSVIGKLIIFMLCSLIVALPVILITGITGVILTITLIGVLGIPFLIGLVAMFYQMTLMEYIEGKQNIWDCFGYSWSLVFSKFWPVVGSVGLFYVMMYIGQIGLSVIPNIFDMVNIYGDATYESSMTIGVIIAIIYLIFNFVINSCMQVVVQLNQGIIFYSLKEEKENINSKSIIDEIGSGE